MDTFDVSYQLIDSPVDRAIPDGSVAEDELLPRFQKFPFAEQIKASERRKGECTYPTLTFKRQSNGDTLAIWTSDAESFDLCLIRDSQKEFLKNKTKEEAQSILAQFGANSLPETSLPNYHSARGSGTKPAPEVFIDLNGRWVAIGIMAIAIGAIYASLHFLTGSAKYITVVSLSLFGLFPIKNALFGFPLKLSSDGRLLSWREGSKTGSIELTQIKKLHLDVEDSRTDRNLPMKTYVQFFDSDGNETELPRNLADGMCAKKWKPLRRLIAHIRTVSPVIVKGTLNSKACIKLPDLDLNQFDVA
jgi:hypothetical protein